MLTAPMSIILMLFKKDYFLSFFRMIFFGGRGPKLFGTKMKI
jgi:hypothetical protein